MQRMPERFATLIGSIKTIAKDAEKDRKATKEPYLEQGRKIDADFEPVKTTADNYVAPLNKMLSDFLRGSKKNANAKRPRKRALKLKQKQKLPMP